MADGHRVSLDIQMDELVEKYPEAVRFLTRRGVRCIQCGEPAWGTLRQLFREDGIKNPELFVDELNVFLKEARKDPGP